MINRKLVHLLPVLATEGDFEVLTGVVACEEPLRPSTDDREDVELREDFGGGSEKCTFFILMKRQFKKLS
jgi:hypothetical protein